MNYNFFEVEEKILNNHIYKNSFKLLKDNLRTKKYVLVLSKDDKTKVTADIYARLYRMQGYNVLLSLDRITDDPFGLSVDFKREIDSVDFEEQFDHLKREILDKNLFFEEDQLRRKMLEYFNQLSIEPKKNEDFVYNNQLGYLIKVDFANELRSIEVFIENCSYVYGATYLKVSCYLKDVENFVSEDEKVAFKEFLSSNDPSFFSGSYIINSFTGKEIPIIILKRMREDYLFGIPDIFEEDYEFALQNDIEIIKIQKNGYLCNCGIADKMDVQTGNKILYDEYYSKNQIRFFEKFNFEYILKNSIRMDTKILKNIYYFYYLPFLIHPYDAEKKERDFNSFFKDSIIFVEQEDNDKINYLLFLDILKNFESENSFLLKNVVVCKKNDIIVNDGMKPRDVMRLQALTQEKNSDVLHQLLSDIWKINFIHIEEESRDLDKVFKYFLEDCLDRYHHKNFDNFHVILKNFLNVVLNIKVISYKQLKTFLIILNPIIPFITEEMHTILFNAKDSLCFENWPWEED